MNVYHVGCFFFQYFVLIQEYVSLLQSSEDPQDIVENLISEGLLAVESRRESKLKHLVSVDCPALTTLMGD